MIEYFSKISRHLVSMVRLNQFGFDHFHPTNGPSQKLLVNKADAIPEEADVSRLFASFDDKYQEAKHRYSDIHAVDRTIYIVAFCDYIGNMAYSNVVSDNEHAFARILLYTSRYTLNVGSKHLVKIEDIDIDNAVIGSLQLVKASVGQLSTFANNMKANPSIDPRDWPINRSNRTALWLANLLNENNTFEIRRKNSNRSYIDWKHHRTDAPSEAELLSVINWARKNPKISREWVRSTAPPPPPPPSRPSPIAPPPLPIAPLPTPLRSRKALGEVSKDR